MTLTTLPPATRSAYPATIDALMPQATALAERIGAVPSLRQLTAELRIGTPKARQVAARLAEPVPTPVADMGRVGSVKGIPAPISDDGEHGPRWGCAFCDHTRRGLAARLQPASAAEPTTAEPAT